ncbi:MAG: hypothetical protein KDE31_04790, partial [Caldilineaceae bacterium]|nr:hypothetical protein [Caldilineaceae bacterium]
MSEHIIAIATYGSHRVKHPQNGQKVSAYKIGYTTAASAVLLSLYGDQAQDVSSKQASYHYIQIDAEVIVRHGYILLKLSDDELTRTETITIQSHRPAVYRWLEGTWQEFPNIRSADYQPTSGSSGPNFNPTGMLIVSASTGEAEPASETITAEKSQRTENETPWWWLRGNTYPHRDVLKRWGCRWSKRNKAWYYIGTQLPDAVRQLTEQVNTPNDKVMCNDDRNPCSIEEATAILGMHLNDSVNASIPVEDDPQIAPSIDNAVDMAAEDEPKIRITKPMLDLPDGAEADPIIVAVRQTTLETLPVLQSPPSASGGRNLLRIPQSPCGELTGSITG